MHGFIYLPAGVFSQSRVIIIDDAGFGVKDNVFQHRSEANGIVNVRLLLRRQSDTLGIALVRSVRIILLNFGCRELDPTYPSFDVEDTLVTPAVLVVTDQRTFGVRR